ncbi:hypothetical protein F4604DRAFT_251637 [Suillus subluteus]|nr:hypothetical protein F4604DRAFT_251637 [Suillus subluteus]
MSSCILILTADKLLTQDIGADGNDYNSYANHSFVKNVSIQPSMMCCISKSIAHGGKRQFQDVVKAFDLAFMSSNSTPHQYHRKHAVHRSHTDMMKLSRAVPTIRQSMRGRTSYSLVLCPCASSIASTTSNPDKAISQSPSRPRSLQLQQNCLLHDICMHRPFSGYLACVNVPQAHCTTPTPANHFLPIRRQRYGQHSSFSVPPVFSHLFPRSWRAEQADISSWRLR